MQTFFGRDRIWPAGQPLLHLYYLPHHAEITPLRDVYLPVLREHRDVLAVVAPEWLHATLLKITVPADTIDVPARSELSARLAAVFQDLPATRLIAGPALAGSSAVVLDITPDDEWNALRAASAEVVADLLGPGSVNLGGGRPHLTLAYGVGDGDSGVIQSQLRRATDMRVPLTLDHVHLVEVTQHADHEPRGYRWTSFCVLPLGTSAR